MFGRLKLGMFRFPAEEAVPVEGFLTENGEDAVFLAPKEDPVFGAASVSPVAITVILA